MITFDPHKPPLVSVIITSYNHAHFLPDALNSVLSQTYPHYDMVVVDDGSTDNTEEVVRGFHTANYVYQKNQGLSAARNKGIELAKGDFVVFLDADDYLYPEALEINLNFFRSNPSCAFVSGWHDKVDEWKYPLETEEQQVFECDHYIHLLRGNYIGMHATVMYSKDVFNDLRFDTSLRACEDYDLYLRIARNRSVANHYGKIAAYRIHGNNMSSRIPFMLEHVEKVCNRQRPVLRNEMEKKALNEGLKNWKEYYTEKLFQTLSFNADKTPEWPTSSELELLLKNKPMGFVKYGRRKLKHTIKDELKSRLPDRVLKSLHHAGVFSEYTPKPGNVEPGDFERKTPFSFDFGFDRGGPIDRFYIEQFLGENSHLIRGNVLEIGDNEYTLRYGGDKVLKSDILHIDPNNEKATYVADISDAPGIPSGTFDCIIFTQTLHLIYDFKGALRTCCRILKPGGSLLMTVPGISHVDHGEWREFWLWSFTDTAIKKILTETFTTAESLIRTYGNVYVAAAFLYGMGLSEFKKEFLVHQDPSYQVIISARVIKAKA